INALFVPAAMLLMSRWAGIPLLIYFFLSPVVFSAAVSCEVFTLNLLFACGIIYLLYSPKRKNATAAAFLFGIGLANHQTLILLVPGIIYLLIRRKMFDFRFVLILTCAALAGFSANLFIFLRAKSGAAFNWGDPSTFSNFLGVLLRRDYGTFALHRAHHAVTLKALLDYPSLGFSFFGPFFVFVPVLYAFNFRKADNFDHFLFLCFLFSGPLFFIAAGLSSPNRAFIEAIAERFFLFPAGVLIIMAGRLLRFAVHRKFFLAFAWAGSLFFAFFLTDSSLRNFYSLSDLADSVIRDVPAEAALVIEKGAVGDDLIFALAYKKWAQKAQMPDIYSAYGSIFPSIYGGGFKKQSPPRRSAARIKFFSGDREKVFFAFSKSQLPFSDYVFDGLLWKKAAENSNGFFWRTSGLKSYRVRSLEILYYYFNLLKNPDSAAAGFCSRLGKDIDWLLTNMGPVWAGLGEREQARKSYEAALKINPELPEASNNLGVLAFSDGDYAAAADYFEDSLNIEYDDVRYYNLGLARMKLGNLSAAKDAFRKCLSINPFNYAAFNELGLMEMRSGNFSLAKKFFQRGLSIKPDEENLKYNLTLCNRGSGLDM
ncbi:MAG: tetratricopeptide repeat protein, partial [Elusimicrobia bacterium]|nr:tetratricopeptide repeat protein [Elusimicrobiota bacterium]